MKSILLFFLLTICNLNDVITALSIQNESVNGETTNTTSTPLTTSTLSQDDYLESISIQDILSSDIDASEKIGNKIINSVTKFSSDCNAYKNIDLSIHDLPLAGDSISINLGTENVIFHDFNLTTTGGEPNNSDEKLHSYSTSIRCQSSKMGEVEAKLPKIIKITAALKVIQISGFLKEVVIPGSISLILRNGSIAKQFSIETIKFTNYQNDISSTIIYSDSEIHLNTDARFQVAIYNKLGTFIKEVESSIKKIFTKKLNEKLLQNGISLTDICSKFETTDESSQIQSSISNNNLNDLYYVIPNAKLETWKGVDLSAGPIIIKGLSSFNSTELNVINHQYSDPTSTGYPTNRPTTSKFGELELKEIAVRIRTNDLRGKLDWSYNNKRKSFIFFLDYIEFEIRKTRRYFEKKVEVSSRLQDIRFKSLKSNVNENESEFALFVLNEYLKSAIVNSIKTSLDEKEKRLVPALFSNCEFLKS